jgi:hypothetical protein
LVLTWQRRSRKKNWRQIAGTTTAAVDSDCLYFTIFIPFLPWLPHQPIIKAKKVCNEYYVIVSLFDSLFLNVLDKIKRFLAEFHKSGAKGLKEFKYATQLTNIAHREQVIKIEL